MSVAKKLTVAVVIAAAAAGVAVIAEDMKNGSMMMVDPSGKMTTLKNAQTLDKPMMDDMMKHAEEMKDGMVIMVWGQKLYVVKNEKMPNGKMTFDYWGLHGQK